MAHFLFIIIMLIVKRAYHIFMIVKTSLCFFLYFFLKKDYGSNRWNNFISFLLKRKISTFIQV